MIIAESTRLFLRPLNENDADDLALVLSDETSMAHYPHPFTSEEVTQWIQRNMQRYAKDRIEHVVYGYSFAAPFVEYTKKT